MEHFLIIILLGFTSYSASNIVFLSLMTLKPAIGPNFCPYALTLFISYILCPSQALNHVP